MSLLRQAVVARLVLLFFGVNILSQPLFIRATYAAEPAAPFNPPWTQERVKPPETENQEPLAWCENTRERKRPDGTVESYNDFRVTYTNGTEVRYEYGQSRKRWVVIVPGPQGRTRTTYDLTDEKKPTRTVEEPGKPPVTTEWKEAVEALKKKGAFLFDPFANRLVRVSTPLSPMPDAAAPGPEQLLLAATAEREKTPPAPQTQERPTINIKPVTYGGPLADPVIHLDPGPATTPEEFVQTPPPVTWTPEDKEGPKTAPPPEDPTTGTPVTYIPKGGINIGSGWASTRVPARVLLNCSGEDEADGTQASSQPRETPATTPGTTERPTQLPGSPKPVEKIETTTSTNRDGSITEIRTFPDGSTITTRRRLDGSITEIRTNRDGSTITTTTDLDGSRSTSTTFPDGSRTTTARESDGRTTTITDKANPDGSRTTTRTNPDGSTTTTTTHPDGSTTTTYPDGSTARTRMTVFGRSTTWTRTQKNPDGSTTTTTTYSDGSTTRTTIRTNPDGGTTTTHPDGSTDTTHPDGSTTRTRTHTFPDGATTTSRIYTDPDGATTTTRTHPQGITDTTRTHPDGSRTTTSTYPDGITDTTRTYPDGSRTTISTYPDGSMTTTTTQKNPDGSTTTTRTFRDGSRTTTTTNPDGSRVERDRDGKITVHDKPTPKP